MIGPQQLFEEFAAAYRRDGAADPREYLARTSGLDREELSALIDAFLERAPRREWDPVAFRGSVAERAVARSRADGTVPEADEAAGWIELLPALRTRAQLKRRTVVERLAAALGFSDQQERVGVYYHQMEQGQLAPSGVSTPVLEALAGIVNTTVEQLRRAGEAGERAGEGGGEVFARVGAPADGMQSPALAVESSDSDRGEPADELARLFTEGD